MTVLLALRDVSVRAGRGQKKTTLVQPRFRRAPKGRRAPATGESDATPFIQPSTLLLSTYHHYLLLCQAPVTMPSPSRGAPPPTDRTPLLAQIDRSLSRSLGRTPTRRSLGRTKSHDRPAAGREDVPALPEDLDEPGASEFIVPTTLGEVVEARDDDDDDDNEAKDEDAVDGGSGDAGTALSRRWRLARSRARY